MPRNNNLHAARAAKSDEFYTRYEDIAAELSGYPAEAFTGMVVLLPCDDPDHSEFVRYFQDNYDVYGLRGLLVSGYVPGGRGKWLRRDAGGVTRGEHEADGDFRSAEVTAFRDEADIVITNPPFSLFREFLAWVDA